MEPVLFVEVILTMMMQINFFGKFAENEDESSCFKIHIHMLFNSFVKFVIIILKYMETVKRLIYHFYSIGITFLHLKSN